jgi:hypothetical protein
MRTVVLGSKPTTSYAVNWTNLDCRKANLRDVTKAQSSWRNALRSNTTTGYTGVSWNKTKKRFKTGKFPFYNFCVMPITFAHSAERLRASNCESSVHDITRARYHEQHTSESVRAATRRLGYSSIHLHHLLSNRWTLQIKGPPERR